MERLKCGGRSSRGNACIPIGRRDRMGNRPCGAIFPSDESAGVKADIPAALIEDEHQ